MAWSEWQVEDLGLKELVYEKKHRDSGGWVVRISSNRPHRMNALTDQGWAEFALAMRAADTDSGVAVVVISGVGDHFGVGGDMQWEAQGGLQDMFEPQAKRVAEREEKKEGEKKEEPAPQGAPAGGFDSVIMESTTPVIAAVKGYCIGGHHHLAYHCDFTIAADNAILGQNGPRVASPVHGFIVSSLAHVVGMKRAKEIWMLCRRYTAQEALALGLVNAVVPLARLDEEVDRWCDELMNLVPASLALIKRSFASIDRYLEADMGKVLNEVAPDFFTLPQVEEAHKAFFEKRTPQFWKDY